MSVTGKSLNRNVFEKIQSKNDKFYKAGFTLGRPLKIDPALRPQQAKKFGRAEGRFFDRQRQRPYR